MSNLTDSGTLSYSTRRGDRVQAEIATQIQTAVDTARHHITEGNLYELGQTIHNAAADLQAAQDQWMSPNEAIGSIVAAVFPNLVEMSDAVELNRANMRDRLTP